MSRYSLLTGSLCLLAGLCFGGVVLTPDVSSSLPASATNGWTTSSHDGLATWQGATNAAVEVAWIAPDIASNVVYHVVVSNGHWLIREGN